MDQSEVADTVRRAAEGDRAAWDAIVESFSGLVWAIARGARLGPADAAEVTQTTWLRLLENIGRIRDPERLGGWIATTARRETLRLVRSRARETTLDDDVRFDAGPADTAPTPEHVVLDNDRDQRLWRAFGGLSERCQRLLRLLVVDTPPYTAVAAAMDMPIGSIGPTRARCLQRLRGLLVAEGVTGGPEGGRT